MSLMTIVRSNNYNNIYLYISGYKYWREYYGFSVNAEARSLLTPNVLNEWKDRGMVKLKTINLNE